MRPLLDVALVSLTLCHRRLLTHNMLASNVKDVENGYPLRIEVQQLETREVEFSAGMRRFVGASLQA